jgi:hypothetical protein
MGCMPVPSVTADSSTGSLLGRHRGLHGAPLGAAVAMLVSVPVAAWWAIGDLSPVLPNHPTLSYDMGPYHFDPSLERAAGLGTLVLTVGCAVFLALATARRQLDRRWWLLLGLASLAGIIAAGAARAATAGYVGADIGGGPIALILGGALAASVLAIAVGVSPDLWRGTAPAGWYRVDDASVRYWNGQAWTAHTAPIAGS